MWDAIYKCDMHRLCAICSYGTQRCASLGFIKGGMSASAIPYRVFVGYGIYDVPHLGTKKEPSRLRKFFFM